MRLWDFHFSYEYIMKMSNFNVVKWNVPCRSRDEGGKQTRWERWGFWRQRCAVVSTVCWAAVETSDDQLPHLLMPANHYTCKYNSFITSSSDCIDTEVRCINPVPVCPRRRALIHSARMPKGVPSAICWIHELHGRPVRGRQPGGQKPVCFTTLTVP